MEYLRDYKGLTIQIDAAWSEENQSNLYRWRVVNSQRAINLEGKQPFRDWMDAYNDAVDVIDDWSPHVSIGCRFCNKAIPLDGIEDAARRVQESNRVFCNFLCAAEYLKTEGHGVHLAHELKHPNSGPVFMRYEC